MNKLFLLAGSLFISSWVMAQNPLSVHVLNLESGLPSPDVKVTLEPAGDGLAARRRLFRWSASLRW